MRVRLLPGAGLVIRTGPLLAVCADGGAQTDALVALVREIAAEAGDAAGSVLIARLAGRLGSDGPDCAVAALGENPAVLVRGGAVAVADARQGTVELRGPILQFRTIDGPLSTLRLSLPGSGMPDPRTSLEAGVVSGAGLEAQLEQPVEPARPEAPASRAMVPARRPDRAVPFEAVILLPGYAPDPGPAPEPPQPATQALVEGVLCRDDHFNDPDQRYCQICGISMAQLTQVSRLGPRPPLGVLLLDDGSTLRLDTDYVVGRDPDVDDDVAAQRANPMRITGPASGVSRRHVRVRLEGWHVAVVDLNSANGTLLHRPGAARPEQLTPGVPAVITPGTRIDLGPRWFRYESHRNT
ncbi:FHA domain-containing protein [Actinoplanes palleronii]|uniref:FHA domain-containing protein n=1 Tax=Actinoplanes palleronii TaxID=113570 RepID=A0ABQ4BRN1_9ACTN|nr:FHA domain-containing protein [Actinoplanes palleronii]GIE73333.1 hypothetical protein Apa02nite_094410 [Actinoplanes palleronii]